jgi:hypothetical protein
MSARDCPFSARLASCALLFVLGQAGCSPKYELLRTLDQGGAGQSFASAGSASGNPAVGGATGLGPNDFGGTSASAAGSDSGGYTSAGTSYGGVGGYGGGGSGLGEACTIHGQCAFGSLCGDYRCQVCPAAPANCPGPCANGFQPLLLARNGCAVCECVPPSECSSNGDCPGDETCYAGAQCADGCSDPTCCFGNHCSRPGCGSARPSLCLAFGCSDGESCLAACEATSCECDGASWACQSTTGGAPVASCPQACAPP